GGILSEHGSPPKRLWNRVLFQWVVGDFGGVDSGSPNAGQRRPPPSALPTSPMLGMGEGLDCGLLAQLDDGGARDRVGDAEAVAEVFEEWADGVERADHL